jgi:hypothetical protein
VSFTPADLRPRDAPPLLLLSQEDILEELRGVYERDEASKLQAETWSEDLLPALRALYVHCRSESPRSSAHLSCFREASHTPLLDIAYAHSPLNTSPPFMPPADVQAVQADAKLKAEDLGDAIAKLQEVRSFYNYTFPFSTCMCVCVLTADPRK